MTRAELVTLLQSRLGQRTSLDTICVSELQLAQQELETDAFLPWFLETSIIDSTTFATVALTRTVAAPTGFIRLFDEDENAVMLHDGTNRIALRRKDLTLMQQDTSLDTDAFPSFFDIVGTNFYFFARPDAVYTGTLNYYAADATLSATGTENLWSTKAPELLIARAGMSIGNALRDPNIVKYFTGLYGDRLDKLKQADAAFRESGRSRTHGESF